MTRPVKGILIIIFTMIAAALLAGQADLAWAQKGSSKNKDVSYTGEHHRNVRVKIEQEGAEIVKGTIFSVRGSTITMDGESFSLLGARIHDQLGIAVEAKDLYPGLHVQLVLKRGSVVSVSIKNYFRGTVTDPAKLKQMRLREMEHKGR